MKKERSYKIVLLGLSGAGKTCLSQRLIKDVYSETESTIGAAFGIMRHDGKIYEIWDTGGQERYLALVSTYYRNADIYLLVCDVTNRQSVERLDYFLNKIVEDVSTPGECIIVVNKLDMATKEMMRTCEALVKGLVDRFDMISINYVFVSNKTGENVGSLRKWLKDCVEGRDVMVVDSVELVADKNGGKCWGCY